MTKKLTIQKILPYVLVIGGIIGLLAAFALSLEKLALTADPSLRASCDINPLISCGSVINTDQAEAFGFPNSLIGVAAFSAVSLIGFALLAGATFKKWFWWGLQLGATFGIAFVLWLQYQSIYNIGALCPYCMVVWVVMIPIFLYTTLYNFSAGNLKARGQAKKLIEIASRHHGKVLAVWYLIVLLLILNQFWSYWSTLI